MKSIFLWFPKPPISLEIGNLAMQYIGYNKYISIIFIVYLPIIVLSNTLNNGNQPDSTLSPQKALLKSAVIPGWGQLYVGKPFKALLYVTAEGYHLYRMIQYHQINNHIEKTQQIVGMTVWQGMTLAEKKTAVENETGYDLQLRPSRVKEKRNKYAWWCVGIYIMGMLDAYVDAHLINFPENKIELSSISTPQEWGVTLSFKLGSGYAD